MSMHPMFRELFIDQDQDDDDQAEQDRKARRKLASRQTLTQRSK